MHEHHLLQLLSGIIQWIDPPEAVSKAIECGRSERSYPCTVIYIYIYIFKNYVSNSLTLGSIFSEMLDGCRAFLSIATVTTPSIFDQLLKSTRLMDRASYFYSAYYDFH